MKKLMLFTVVLAAAGVVRADIPPIEGDNAVGFLGVPAPAGANSLITVPFEACLGEGANGTLADLVAANGLTSHASDPALADQLVVLTEEAGAQVYYYYWLQTDEGWVAVATQQLMPDGTQKTLSPPAADEFALSRGDGFWIKRVAGATSEVYVKGQVPSASQSTLIAAGLNLVGYGAVTGLDLNGADWTGAYGGTGNTATSDKIMVQNGSGGYTEYFYFTKPSDWPAGYDALDGKWITKSGQVADVTVPAGKGFWYLRRGPESFNFQPDGE
jgi:hypothetical protein